MIDFIAQLTGQKDIENCIILGSGNPSAYLLEAPNGSGKSTLCDHIAKTWEAKANDRITIIFRPEALLASSDFEPFFNAISRHNEGKKDAVHYFFSEGSKDIPFIGNTIAAIFSIAYEEKSTGIKMLTDQERSIIKFLDSIIGKKLALIICEDIEMWDDSSLHLLNILVNRKVKKQSLENMTFLITCNKASSHLSDFFKKCITVSLHPISTNDVAVIMKYFSESFNGTPEQCKTLAAISGGNLQLLKECSTLLNFLNVDNGEETLSFFKLISRRIESYANRPEQVILLLKLASIIGGETKKLLLQKFVDGQVEQFIKALEESINLDILEEDKDSVRFIQSAIYESFYNSIGKDACEYHIRLERCINALYPSAYKMRAMNLFNGGELDRALILYVVYLVGFFRNHGYRLELSDILGELLKKHYYYGFYNQICDAYQNYFNNEYEKAHIALLQMDELIIEFIFEIDYLEALIFTNWRYTISDFEEGILHLKKWDYQEFKNNCAEMWLRAATLLIDYEYEMEIQPEGKDLLTEIQRIFDEKGGIDSTFQNRKYTFFLKANVHSKIETAYYQTQKALNYFSTYKTFNIRKYYLAILNHSANELVYGNFEASFQLTKDAMYIVRGFSDICFLKNEILTNNHVISGYLSGNYSVEQCLNLLSQYYGVIGNYADDLLINNNIVAFMALRGDYPAATILSQSICEQIDHREDTDSYYKYYLLNNRMVMHFLNGEWKEVWLLLDILRNTIPLENDKYYFTARNKYIEEVITSQLKVGSLPSDWNDIMIMKYPKTIGVAWKFWGKLLLFSDLQTWSDC